MINMFQSGWNHQLLVDMICNIFCISIHYDSTRFIFSICAIRYNIYFVDTIFGTYQYFLLHVVATCSCFLQQTRLQ